MKKILAGLLLAGSFAMPSRAAVTVVQGSSFTYVMITTALQPNTTGPWGINVGSGTIIIFNVANIKSTGTWTLNGSTLNFTNGMLSGTLADASTATHTGIHNFQYIGVGPGASGTPISNLDITGPGNSRGGILAHEIIFDTAAVALGVGGGISFEGNYTGNTKTVYGLMKGRKINATPGDYGGDLVGYAIANGDGGLSEVARFGKIGNRAALQPSFLATQANVRTDITGDGTAVPLSWQTESYDRGSNFVTSTFTVPVDGVYSFGCQVALQGILSGHTGVNVAIDVNGNYAAGGTYRTFKSLTGVALSSNDSSTQITAQFTTGDKIMCSVSVSGGTKVVDAGGDATREFFWGYLNF